MPIEIYSGGPGELGEGLSGSFPTPRYIIFFASPAEDGLSWCSDCRCAEPQIREKFANRRELTKMVYVGQRDEWADSSNPYRQVPFKIERLPTVLKILGDNHVERLVEEEVLNKALLDAFVE